MSKKIYPVATVRRNINTLGGCLGVRGGEKGVGEGGRGEVGSRVGGGGGGVHPHPRPHHLLLVGREASDFVMRCGVLGSLGARFPLAGEKRAIFVPRGRVRRARASRPGSRVEGLGFRVPWKFKGSGSYGDSRVQGVQFDLEAAHVYGYVYVDVQLYIKVDVYVYVYIYIYRSCIYLGRCCWFELWGLGFRV